jgi:hypothetical protein
MECVSLLKVAPVFLCDRLCPLWQLVLVFKSHGKDAL